MMKNLIVIAICAFCLSSCVTVGETAYASNYNNRIGTSQKTMPLKTRKMAREFAQSTPINSNPSFVFEDRSSRDWTSPRQPWNHWPNR